MKNSYKVAGLLAVLALGALPQAVLATPSVTLTQSSGYSYSDGGEFTAVTAGGPTFTGNGYSSKTLVGGGFQTFCIESTVYFSPGQAYSYTLSTTTDSQGQALTQGAAYLYYQFATGNLSGYNYTAGSGRTASAGALQAAIWYLMGGQSVAGWVYTAANITSDSFYNLAVAEFGTAAKAAAAYTGGSVEILELSANGTPAQNQLVLTGVPMPNGSPVPDGSTTVLLLGAALSGLALLKRKLSA
jgi:hypothetical protein